MNHLRATESRTASALAIAGVTAAFWPAWKWYLERMAASPEDRVGLAALALFVYFSVRDGGGRRVATGAGDPVAHRRSRAWFVPTGIVGVYAVAGAWLPPLLGAVLAVVALASVSGLVRGRGAYDPARWGLALLALPILPSLDFFLGYPLRQLVAHLGAALLQGAGFSVEAAGACFRWDGGLVAVDAPCSGVRMLYAGALLTAALAALYRLSPRLTAAAAALAAAVVIGANVFRATSLFLLEAGVLAPLAEVAPAWHERLHEGVGLLLFGVACGLITAGVAGLAARADSNSRQSPSPGGASQCPAT